MLLGEEADDIRRHVFADAVDVVKFAPRIALRIGGCPHRLAPARQAAVMPREELRRRFADLGNAERINEAVESDIAARIDCGDQLFGADLAPAFARGDLSFVETEDVRRALDQIVVPEIDDMLFAEAFDIEGITGNEMLEALDRLRRADQTAAAAPGRFAFLTHRLATAFRTD